ncbi:hypothetical protein NQ318_014647 [Aromia moschata]|uniref:Uncharacterized protein n=1 Tax=Aromia moschata TaxID=1265417 RepID=A0AAV8ZBY1_9CUCU|nr:hypothetical protein NQ318_014647 [Aromia moschata]
MSMLMPVSGGVTGLTEFSGRIDGVEQHINRIEKVVEENKEEIERKFEKKSRRQVQREILEKIEGLGHQLHRTSITDLEHGSVSPGTPLQHSSLMHAERSVHKILKAPTYDGQSSWSMYRRQFEAAAKANGWTSLEMATSLVISLRGQALEILQSIPEEQQNDYSRIVEDEWSSEELKKSQKKDSDLKLIRNWVQNGVRPTWQEISRYGTTIKGDWAQWNSLCRRNGLLHRNKNPPSVRRTAQQPNRRTFWSNQDFGSSKGPILLGKLSPRRRRMVQEMDWDKLVPLFLMSYRSSQYESTTYTQSMLTSGREMKLPTDLILDRPLEENQERSLPEFVENLRERMDQIHRIAREQLKIHSDKMKQRLDTTSTETAFKPGDAVWLYAPKRTKGKSSKLQSNWEGPYTIIKWSIWKGSQNIQDVIHPIGLSSRIHRLGLKTVLFGTNNLKEGSSLLGFVRTVLLVFPHSTFLLMIRRIQLLTEQCA